METSTGPLVIAHRGASVRERENTVRAFEVASELGADWVELDVRRTADGVIVVHHDAHYADGRLLRSLTGEELPDDVPSLAEAFEACGDLGVNIEIKNLPEDPDFDNDHEVADAVAGMVRAYRSLDKVLVSSFNINDVDRIRQIDPEIPTAWLFFEMASVDQVIERAVAHGLDAVNPYVGFVDHAFVEKANQAGLKVYAWTVDDPERIAELAEQGVDGIVTNVPDIALKALGRS
jgi:glycerophosphoryl diester phosphodiesterase